MGKNILYLNLFLLLKYYHLDSFVNHLPHILKGLIIVKQQIIFYLKYRVLNQRANHNDHHHQNTLYIEDRHNNPKYQNSTFLYWRFLRNLQFFRKSNKSQDFRLTTQSHFFCTLKMIHSHHLQPRLQFVLVWHHQFLLFL